MRSPKSATPGQTDPFHRTTQIEGLSLIACVLNGAGNKASVHNLQKAIASYKPLH